MIVIHGLIFAALFVLAIVSRKEETAGKRELFGRSSRYLARKLADRGNVFEPQTVRKALLVLAAGNLLAGAVTVSEMVEASQELTAIERESGSDDSYEIELQVGTSGEGTETVTLTVPDRWYTEEEISEWFAKGTEEIMELILGDNTDPNHIDHELDLISELPDTAVSVSWESSDYTLIGSDGILGEDIPEKGADVTLTAVFSCQDQTETTEIAVTVYPDVEHAGSREALLQTEFESLNEENSTGTLMLPTELQGESLIWSAVPEGKGLSLLLLTAGIAVYLVIWQKQREKEQKEKRREQMFRDYPEILNQFALLLNAGMNTRNAFARIALDYQKQKEAGDGRFSPRAAYEELLTVYQEIRQGVPEAEAYEHLGARCGLSGYRTFATLLVQNLKKGNRELAGMIEREAAEAFEDRKRTAKVLSEKAGTRLLMPMMLMLVIVFVILLYPASSGIF